jgi:hypothetical protein
MQGWQSRNAPDLWRGQGSGGNMTDKDWQLYSVIGFGVLFYFINRFGKRNKIGEARFDSESGEQKTDD